MRTMCSPASSQNGVAQVLVLREPLIERDYFVVDGLSKYSQVGIVPEFRGTRLMLCKRSTDRLETIHCRDIDVKKTNLPRPSVHQSARWLDARCREQMNGPMGTRLASGFSKHESSAKYEQQPSRVPLPGGSYSRQAPPLHFVQHLEFPYSRYRDRVASNQVDFRQPEARN